MNKKTRGYTSLNLCSAFLVIFGVLYFASGMLAVFGNASGDPRMFVESLVIAGLSFLFSILSFTFAMLIQLAIHVADDLYMLRLIKVNEYAKASKTRPASEA